MKKGILLIQCKDQEGLLASICQFIHRRKGNITRMSEYVDSFTGTFFSRVEWDMTGFQLQDENDIIKEFKNKVGEPMNMNFQFHLSERRLRMAIFVSKYSHCIEDLFYRYRNGELQVEIPMVISNHKKLEKFVEQQNIPFFHLPISKTNIREQELKQIELMEQYEIDFIVLARYMQILSESFVNQYKNKIINIHHSFLPAFTGAKPYHAAYERGVKIIGATAHFVTTELDQGPIICQDVTKTTHRDAIEKMILKGRDIEKAMLSQAVKLFTQHQIMVTGNKTVVFDY